MTVKSKDLNFVEFVTYFSMDLTRMPLPELVQFARSSGLSEKEALAGIYGLIKKEIIRPQGTYGFDKKEPLREVVKNDPNFKIELDIKVNERVMKSQIAFKWLKKEGHSKKNRDVLEKYYKKVNPHKTGKECPVETISKKLRNLTFLAKVCCNYAKKFEETDKSLSARYYVSAALYYYESKSEDPTTLFIRAADIFKELHNVYKSLEYYRFAFSTSKNLRVKRDIIKRLPLPNKLKKGMNVNNFGTEYSEIEKKMDGFTESLMKTELKRAHGILATLSFRFNEYLNEALEEQNGEKLKIVSRIFYHMLLYGFSA